MKAKCVTLLGTFVLATSAIAYGAEGAWTLGPDVKTQVRRDGSVQEVSGETLRIDDLILPQKQSFLFTKSKSKIETAENTVIILNDEQGRVRLYRGAVRLDDCTNVVVAVDGCEFFCWSASGWIGFDGEILRVSIDAGAVDVLGVQDIRRLKANEDVVLQNGCIIKNPRLNGETGSAILAKDGLKSWLLQPGHSLEDRYLSLSPISKDAAKSPRDAVLMALEIANKYGWKASLEKGRELLFAQDLMMLDEQSSILPQQMRRHFLDNKDAGLLFDALSQLDESLSSWSKSDRRYVNFFVRQAMVDDLTSKGRQSIAWGGRVRVSAQENSNVNETADGLNIASEKSGSSLSSSLKLEYLCRQRDWGVPSLEFNYSDKTYFDRTFEDREYNQLSLKAKTVVSLDNKKSFISKVTPSFDVRSEFVNSKQGRNHQVMAYTSQMEMVFKPYKELNSYSDFLVGFCSIGLELRDYVTGQNIDALGYDKDAWVPYLNGVLVNIVKVRDWNCRETMVLGVRDGFSDADLQNLLTLSADLSVEFTKGSWGIKPTMAYRDKTYGDGRTDQKTELGTLLIRKVKDEDMELQWGYRWASQDSTSTTANYIDHQWSMGMNWTF